MFSYTVTCTFEDAEIERTFCDWLQHTHIADVCAAGAIDAEIVRFEGFCEVRYHFESRAAFDAYERDHAPRLRDDAARHARNKVKWARRTGEVLAIFPPRYTP